MSDDLNSVEYAMLILLQNEGRELSNTEMDKLYGVRLVSPLYERLNADGYVVSATKSRPYRHTISRKGRDELAKALVTEAHGGEAEKRGFREKVLWAAVVAQHNNGQRSGGRKDPVDSGANGAVGLDDRIRAAYQVLTDKPGEWVSLTKIRGLFIDVPTADLDRTLTAMLDAPDVRLEPETHAHRIDAKLRDAAVRVSGEERHKLAIGRS
jgi:hypothetical protein